MNILKSVLATISYALAIELAAVWIFIPGSFDHLQYYLLIQGFIQLLMVGLFITLVNRKNSEPIWNRSSWKWYIVGISLGASFGFIQAPMNWLYNLIFESEYLIVYDFDGMKELWNANTIARMLLIPMGEELFFRGFIQQNLQKQLNPIGAVLISSILFASIHLPYAGFVLDTVALNWHLVYITMFGGIISGLIYYKSNSIWPSILFHAFWNLLVIIA